MQFKNKFLLRLASLLFLASAITLFFWQYTHTDSYLFQKFSRDLLVSELSSDTLSMHYTLSQPENYGIMHYTPTLPVYDRSVYINENLALENHLQFLSSIKEDSLTREDQLSYRILVSNLEQQLEGQHYLYYNEPLSPNSGMQSQLPILLTEYYFSNEKDVLDYLSLLSSIPDFFEGMLSFEQEKAAASLFMAAYSADKVIYQCHHIIEYSSLVDDSHFLITTFDERLAKLVEQNLLSEAEADAYSTQNKELLLHTVLPAYRNLAKGIRALRNSGTNEAGLSRFPKGRAYYQFLLRKNTGSIKDIDSIMEILQERLRNDYQTIQQLSTSLQQSQNKRFSFPLHSPESMIADLQKRIVTEFPAFEPPSSKTAVPVVPSCHIKKVDPDLSDYVSPAFYLTPPIDRMQYNTIYINEKSIVSDIELYTTLSHEGYPGHLYQTVYFQLHEQNSHANPIRNLFYYGGYIEGWALYVENHSYEYAKALMIEASPKDASYLTQLMDLYRYDRDLQLCLYAILDLVIHYDGFEYEEVYSMLAEFGITDDTTVRKIYEYIVEEPTNYLKYYLGYLEVLECKKSVQEMLGTHYTETAFHKLILEAGPMDFPMLTEYIQNTLKNKHSNSLRMLISA